MLLSIIIPTCNRPKLLRRALYSIKSDYNSKIEIVICDDHSSDACIRETKKIISEFTNMKIVYYENNHKKGVAGARNCAVSSAKGEWLLFLDDDDEITNNYLTFLLQHLKMDCNSDFIWSNVYLKQTINGNSYIQNMRFSSYCNIGEISGIGISYGVCIKKDLFNLIQGFDETFIVAEDTDFILRCIENNTHFMHLNIFGIIKNNDTGNNLSLNFRNYTNNKVMEKLYKKNSFLFENDINMFHAFFNRGRNLYLKEKKYINYFIFIIFCFIHCKNTRQFINFWNQYNR